MKTNQVKIVVFNVSLKCNLACPFCFGPEKEKKGPSKAEAKLIIERAVSEGVNKVVFTGGEPLLRKDLVELIKYAKQIGLFTILHTNGILFTEKVFQKLRLYLDQINFPLDGYNSKTNDSMRIKGHFKKVIKDLELLKKEKIKVIISTVATLKNKENIIKIGETLSRLTKEDKIRIDKWRIFQFKPEGKAIKVKDEFYLPDEEFKEIAREITKEKYPFEIQIVANKDKKFYESYYLV